MGGGEMIGLSSAWRLGELGWGVTVIDKEELGRGASWAAAGMLSPAAEIGFEELDLYRLGCESLRRWPEFAKQLERSVGASVGYQDEGTLTVAVGRGHPDAGRGVAANIGSPNHIEYPTTENYVSRHDHDCTSIKAAHGVGAGGVPV